MGEWTGDKVRQELPSVEIRIGKFVTTGEVFGRKNKFATVTFSVPVGGVELSVSREFSWDTIAFALNNDRKLGM